MLRVYAYDMLESHFRHVKKKNKFCGIYSSTGRWARSAQNVMDDCGDGANEEYNEGRGKIIGNVDRLTAAREDAAELAKKYRKALTGSETKAGRIKGSAAKQLARDLLGTAVKNSVDPEAILSEAEDNVDLSQFQDGLKLHITGSRYDSSLDTSIMEYFVAFQKNINDVYSIRKHGKIQNLSNEEKERLRVFVQIRPGSAIAEVRDFLDIMSIISGGDIRMTTGTAVVLAVGAIALVGLAGYKVWALKSKNAIEREKLRLEAIRCEIEKQKNEIELKRCEVEEQRNAIELKRCERDIRQCEMVEKIFDTTMENHAKMFRALAVPKDARIAIGEQEIAPEVLKDEGTVERMPEMQWTETISGLCKVLDITFDYGTETSFATIKSLKTDEIIDKVNLQDCFLSPEKLAFIKEAEKKEPIELTINVNRKGKKVENAYLKLEGYINDDPSLRKV